MSKRKPVMRQRIYSIITCIRAFAGDLSGMAAVEFAYLAPLLMLMTFGTFEFTRALVVYMRFQTATAMVGDLVAREKQLWPDSEADSSATTSDAKATLKGIMLAAQYTMQPFNYSTLNITVSQLWASISDATKTKIEWTYQYPSGVTSGCGSLKTMPASNMVSPGGRAIVVEATYQYTPLLTNIIPGLIKKMNWSDTMTFAPRDVPSVQFLPGLNNDTTWTSPSTAPCS